MEGEHIVTSESQKHYGSNLLGSRSEGDPSWVSSGEIWTTPGLYKYLNTDSKSPGNLDLGLSCQAVVGHWHWVVKTRSCTYHIGTG